MKSNLCKIASDARDVLDEAIAARDKAWNEFLPVAGKKTQKEAKAALKYARARAEEKKLRREWELADDAVFYNGSS